MTPTFWTPWSQAYIGLWVRHRNEDAVVIVETSDILEAEKSTVGPQQCQGHVDVFFDSHGVVHHEYAPQGQTIRKEYYQEVLRRLHDAVRHKQLDLWAEKSWQLHHDNAPAHSAHVIQTFLAKHNIPVVRQAPYSPDMALCDFWLFPKLKMTLKGTRFESREDIMQNLTNQLNTIPITSVPRVFRKMAEALREVCASPRRLLWRGFKFWTSKSINYTSDQPRLRSSSRTYYGY